MDKIQQIIKAKRKARIDKKKLLAEKQKKIEDNKNGILK